MSNPTEMSLPFKSTVNATNWFDAISQNPSFTPAAGGGGGVSAVKTSTQYTSSPIKNDGLERTPSTIRFNEDSTASPLDILNATQSLPSKNQNNTMRTEISEHPAAKDTSLPNMSPNHVRSRHENLYEDAMRAQLAKRQWAAMEQMRQSMLEEAKVERDCPFKPRLSSYAARIQRPAHLAPQHRFYDELLQKEEWRAKKREETVKEELRGCTFRPLTVRAATLKSSALVHDSHIFSELFDSHEERIKFRDEVQPYVVEQLERHMLFKSPCNKTIPENKLNAVMERLFSRGVVVRHEESKPKRAHNTSPPFKQILNAESDRIVARQREGNQVQGDVVDRLLSPSLSNMQHQRRQDDKKRLENDMQKLHSQYNRQLHDLLNRERQKTLIAAKFDILSQTINIGEKRSQRHQRQGTQYRVEDLVKAAVVVLSPEEAEELCEIMVKSGSRNLSKSEFVDLCEKFLGGLSDSRKSFLASLPPPRQTAAAAPAEIEVNTVSTRAKPQIFQRVIPSAEVMAAMRAQRAERDRQGAEEIKIRRREMEEQERKQCTFHPFPRRKIPHECRVDFNVEVKMTRAETLRRAHIQKTMNSEEQILGSILPIASIKGLFGTVAATASGNSSGRGGGLHPDFRRSQSVGALSPDQRKQQLLTQAALVTMADPQPPTKTPGKDNRRRVQLYRSHSASPGGLFKQNNTASLDHRLEKSAFFAATVDSGASGECDTKKHTKTSSRVALSSQPSARHPRVYRDVVSEHAAFGRDGALTEFGRELILKQLAEYKGSHK